MDTDNTIDVVDSGVNSDVDSDTSTEDYELPLHPWYQESLSFLNDITPVGQRKVFFGGEKFLGKNVLVFEPTVFIGGEATARFLSTPFPLGYCTNPASAPDEPEEVDLMIYNHLDMDRNMIGDQGFAAAIQLASRNPHLLSIRCPGNFIEFYFRSPYHAAFVFMDQLSQSILGYLMLDNNKMSVNIECFKVLFQTWAYYPNPPPLQELHLQYCSLGRAHAIALACFALSPASSKLQVLYLDNNNFDAEAFGFLSMMLEHNYTLRAVSRYVTHAYESNFNSGGTWRIPEDDDAAMEFLELASETCDRNEALHDRIVAATRRALPFLRMVVHAKPLKEEDTDPDQQGLKLKSNLEEQETQMGAEPSPKPFPFMKLPYEVRLLVARYASGDPRAFSTGQWSRLLTEVEKPDALKSIASWIGLAQTTTGRVDHRFNTLMEEWMLDFDLYLWESEDSERQEVLKLLREASLREASLREEAAK